MEELQYVHLPWYIMGWAESGPHGEGAVLLDTTVLGSSMTESDAISHQCLGIVALVSHVSPQIHINTSRQCIIIHALSEFSCLIAHLFNHDISGVPPSFLWVLFSAESLSAEQM